MGVGADKQDEKERNPTQQSSKSLWTPFLEKVLLLKRTTTRSESCQRKEEASKFF